MKELTGITLDWDKLEVYLTDGMFMVAADEETGFEIVARVGDKGNGEVEALCYTENRDTSLLIMALLKIAHEAVINHLLDADPKHEPVLRLGDLLTASSEDKDPGSGTLH